MRPRTSPRPNLADLGPPRPAIQFMPIYFGTTMRNNQMSSHATGTERIVLPTLDIPDVTSNALDFPAEVSESDWRQLDHWIQNQESPSVALTVPAAPLPVSEAFAPQQTMISRPVAREDSTSHEDVIRPDHYRTNTTGTAMPDRAARIYNSHLMDDLSWQHLDDTSSLQIPSATLTRTESHRLHATTNSFLRPSCSAVSVDYRE